MTAILDLTPQIVDLKLQLGDDRILTMRFWTDSTKLVALNVSSYTSWISTIRGTDGTLVLPTIDTTLASTGIVKVRIVGSTLRTLPLKGTRWDIAATISGDATTLVTGRVVFKTDQSQ